MQGRLRRRVKRAGRQAACSNYQLRSVRLSIVFLREQRSALPGRLEPGTKVARVGRLKVHVAQQADVPNAVQKLARQLSEAARAYAVAAVFGCDIHALEICSFRRLRDNVSFEYQLAVSHDNEDPALIDPADDTLQKAFAVDLHRVPSAFSEGDLGLSFGYFEQLCLGG